MRTYVLFVFGDFNDHDDVVFFINDIVSTIPSVSALKYIMENGENLIVIFESDKSDSQIMQDMFKAMGIEQVEYYFLFEKEGLLTAKLPKNLKDNVFKPKVTRLKSNETKIIYDLDELLDKIDKNGVNSLTPDEKKFLDNFEN